MRKHNYVVGYKGNYQCVYGKELVGRYDWIDLMTLKQAQKLSKKIVSQGVTVTSKSVVYKLVEVKVRKE